MAGGSIFAGLSRGMLAVAWSNCGGLGRGEGRGPLVAGGPHVALAACIGHGLCDAAWR